MDDHQGIYFFYFLFSVLFIFPGAHSASFRWTWGHRSNYHVKIKQIGPVLKLTTNAKSAATFDPTRASQISWQPRVFSYNNFLTDEECDHLINLAKENLEKSMVIDDETGNSVGSDVQTSSGKFLQTAQAKRFQQKDDSWSYCAKKGYAVKPRKGDTLLFYNLHPNSTADRFSYHGSCPVIEVCVCVFNICIVMGRPPCCDKSNVKKGPWTPEEDAKVLAYVANHGIGNWTLVPEKAGLNRCGKSCRLRWTNYLRPDLKHDAFTPQEEKHILILHQTIGSRWSLIAKHLPGRTDNDVKNHWNTKLRKKLMKMGIDPVTHKPFSQLLTEFGNISGFPSSRNHIDPLSNIVNNSMSNSEPSVLTTEHTTPTMLNRPTMEQFQDNPFNNYQLDNATTSFQVTNQETVEPHFFNEISSPLSSSSSCNITQLMSPQSFQWQSSHQLQAMPSSTTGCDDYLVGDLSLPTDSKQQQEPELQEIMVPSSYPSVLLQNGHHFRDDTSSLSAVDLFVDSILNQDKELQLEFSQLLPDGYFNY